MDPAIETRRGQRPPNRRIHLRAAAGFQTRQESGEQLKADRAIETQVEGSIAGKSGGAAHAKVGVGAAQAGLLDAHFVLAIRQPHGSYIFQLYIFIVERDARKICLDCNCFRPRSESGDREVAVHQTVAVHAGKVHCGDDEWVEIDVLGIDFGCHGIIAFKGHIHFAGQSPCRHGGVNRRGQMMAVGIHFPIKTAYHVAAQL